MKRSFILITGDGQTLDNEGNFVENEQVLDYINTDNALQAQEIVKKNMAEKKYGDFQDYKIVEIQNLCHKTETYMLLIAPASLGFGYSIIEDIEVYCFNDKRNVLKGGILNIDDELIKAEKVEKGLDSLNFSTIVSELLSLDECIDLETKLDCLSDQDLESVWKKLFDIQFEKDVIYHTEIRKKGEMLYNTTF